MPLRRVFRSSRSWRNLRTRSLSEVAPFALAPSAISRNAALVGHTAAAAHFRASSINTPTAARFLRNSSLRSWRCCRELGLLLLSQTLPFRSSHASALSGKSMPIEGGEFIIRVAVLGAKNQQLHKRPLLAGPFCFSAVIDARKDCEPLCFDHFLQSIECLGDRGAARVRDYAIVRGSGRERKQQEYSHYEVLSHDYSPGRRNSSTEENPAT